MSEKLGFTFYPKDWWTSDTFFDLDFTERYIFLECMFSMYQNDGFMKTQKTQLERRHNIKITDEQWENVTSKFIIVDGMFTLVSVNKRLKKAIANRANGVKGGRPPKPKEPKSETQKNPPLEREGESESEKEKEDKVVEETVTPQTYSIYDFEEEVSIGENQFTLLASRQTELPLKTLQELMPKFLDSQKLGEKKWDSLKDAKLHFINWAKKQPKPQLKQVQY